MSELCVVTAKEIKYLNSSRKMVRGIEGDVVKIMIRSEIRNLLAAKKVRLMRKDAFDEKAAKNRKMIMDLRNDVDDVTEGKPVTPAKPAAPAAPKEPEVSEAPEDEGNADSESDKPEIKVGSIVNVILGEDDIMENGEVICILDGGGYRVDFPNDNKDYRVVTPAMTIELVPEKEGE